MIILDNLSIHTTPAVRAWLTAQDGRVRFEFLPLHASWLNQVEIWFSILERQALARASDAIYEARAARIVRFVDIGTAPPGLFGGRSRAIPCPRRVGWNLWGHGTSARAVVQPGFIDSDGGCADVMSK